MILCDLSKVGTDSDKSSRIGFSLKKKGHEILEGASDRGHIICLVGVKLDYLVFSCGSLYQNEESLWES